jgi:putative CocE/NonD family hydrolase
MDIDAMHLTVTSPDMKEVLYTGGELHLMTIYFWSSIMGEHKAATGAAVKLASDLDKYISTLPLSEADDKVGRDVDYFNHALDPKKIWELYQDVNFDDQYKEVSAPAVFVAGWYDMFSGPQLNDFNKLSEQGGGNADRSILIVGPWGHGPNGDGTVDYGEEAGQKKALGPAHVLDWFDYWLKDVDNGVDEWPRVKIFVMGINEWRDEDEWPLARTQYTKYYIHSGGGANTRDGDGFLSTEPPSADEPEDEFDYDPLDPVPTLGGNNLGLNLGAYDQSDVEDREDVLCYTTPPLEHDVEVTGPITATLYAASDAVDTDFTVKLVDVYPGGTPVNIQDGIVRAMYRNNDPKNPTPLTPGAVEKYELDLWATSNVFKAGHRIRVEISSSHFPRFNRNLNTGEPPADAVRSVIAHQTIYHTPEYPTHIILPIIPGDVVAMDH